MDARKIRAKRNPWTANDVAYLKEHYTTMNTEELAERLGRNVNCVRGMAGYCGLKKPKTRTQWTDDKIAWIRENYDRLKLKEMAAYFGCSEHCVANAARTHGIRKSGKKGSEYQAKNRRPEPKYKEPSRIGENKNPITGATKTLVCICVLDNMTPKEIAAMTARSVEQVEEVIVMVKESGYLAWIENRKAWY